MAQEVIFVRLFCLSLASIVTFSSEAQAQSDVASKSGATLALVAGAQANYKQKKVRQAGRRATTGDKQPTFFWDNGEYRIKEFTNACTLRLRQQGLLPHVKRSSSRLIVYLPDGRAFITRRKRSHRGESGGTMYMSIRYNDGPIYRFHRTAVPHSKLPEWMRGDYAYPISMSDLARFQKQGGIKHLRVQPRNSFPLVNTGFPDGATAFRQFDRCIRSLNGLKASVAREVKAEKDQLELEAARQQASARTQTRKPIGKSPTPALDALTVGLIGAVAYGVGASSKEKQSSSSSYGNSSVGKPSNSKVERKVSNAESSRTSGKNGGYQILEHITYSSSQKVVARGECSDGTKFNIRYSPNTGTSYRYTIYTTSGSSKDNVAKKFCKNH